MNLIDRIKYIIKLNSLSSASFADKIGVQRSSISHVLSGRNKPSLEFIQKILTAYPKISADWLINGKTNIEQDNLTIKEKSEEETTNPPSTLSNKEKQIKKIVIFYTDNTFEEVISQTVS
jgi:transcriptional regulator with XRE-family HTH domain